MNTQFNKGILELCVLSRVGRSDVYGYELVRDISKTIEISEGTIYPILRRLTDDKFCETYLQESNEGPPRKYYVLTEEGKVFLDAMQATWFELADSVAVVIKRSEELSKQHTTPDSN